MVSKLFVRAGVALGFGLLTPTSYAGPVIVLSDPADSVFRSDGRRGDVAAARVGASTGAPGAGARVDVLVFQLPAPGPGESAVVAAASFTFTILTNYGGNAYNIDLYGLPARASKTMVNSDPNFYVGASDPSAGAWKLADNILTASNTLVGTVQTDTSTSSLLTDYLNAQYGADGSGAGKYVFIRLNPDSSPPSENSGVDIAQSEFGSSLPQLTITFVPEPALVAPLSLALLTALRPRRRR